MSKALTILPGRIVYQATAQVKEGVWQGAYTDVQLGVRNAFLETFKEGEAIQVTIERVSQVENGSTIENICQQAIDKYGQDAQVDMCIEECSELINALEKWRRGRNIAAEVCTEIADVYIMCHQMMLLFGEIDTIQQVSYKLNRLVERMGGQAHGNQ